jgi:hypothetical protein
MDIFQLTEKVEAMQVQINQLSLQLLVKKEHRADNEKLINRLFTLV